jgi:tRNA1Val (adenine37-N6)-methyltransferase
MNSYFDFKQFRIEQDKCAMKVTTDACIQGAWTPILPSVRRVLDIGVGSGLLALMLAQRSQNVSIDGIEYDTDAAAQARENLTASPWSSRTSIIEADAREYRVGERYDLIITNPPFFNNSLLSDKQQKNLAKHTGSLSYAELLDAVDANLSEGGYLSILLPAAEYEVWTKLALSKGWVESGKLMVRHREEALVKRIVGLFSRVELPLPSDSLVIQDDAGQYTADFKSLLCPFYLAL